MRFLTLLISINLLAILPCKTGVAMSVFFPAGCTDPTAVNYNPNATEDDGSCVYDTLELGLSLVGSNEICAGQEVTFIITGIGSLSVGTDLVIHFSDGSPALTFSLDALPAGNSFTHTFPFSSCGSTSSNGVPNAFTVSVTAYDLIDIEYAWDTVDPIYVSGASQFAQSGLFQSPPSGPYCINQTLSFVNFSQGYFLVDAGGCNQNYVVDFFTDATAVDVQAQNTSVFPEFIELSFSQEGTYEVMIELSEGCFYESTSVTVEIGPVEGTVSLWTFDESSLLPIEDMQVNLYNYGLQPQQFNSFISFSDVAGAVQFDNVPQGIYLSRATPDLSIPGQENTISTFTNEKVQWSQANLIVMGCASHYKDTIYVKNQVGPNSFGGVAAGRLVYRDVFNGMAPEDPNAEVRSFVEGDPIPGIPVIIGKDTATVSGNVPFFNPIGMQLTSGGTIDQQGYFNFENLQAGSYRIHVDMPGLPMAETYFFTIEPQNPAFSNLNFYADSTLAIFISDLNSISVSEHGKFGSLSVYPNPSEALFQIEWPENFEFNTGSVGFFDVTGKQVYPKTKSSTGGLSVDFSDFSPGIYTAYLKYKDAVWTTRLMKF